MELFTFWEGEMPSYIKLCLETWHFPHIILNYKNLNEYTNCDVKPLIQRGFSLAQIADFVRVHVLRDSGGYWLDTDTIILKDELPQANILGELEKKTNTIGFLHTEKESNMYKEWATFQEKVVPDPRAPGRWSCMGNDFTDKYLMNHLEIKVDSITPYWPETYMINGDMPRMRKYEKFYFNSSYHLSDIKETSMLMLHNSWTPTYYKKFTKEGVLSQTCTLSNILNEVLK